MKFVTITHYQVHITLITFSRSWVERSKSDIIFSENVLFQLRYSDRQFAVEDSRLKAIHHNIQNNRCSGTEFW